MEKKCDGKHWNVTFRSCGTQPPPPCIALSSQFYHFPLLHLLGNFFIIFLASPSNLPSLETPFHVSSYFVEYGLKASYLGWTAIFLNFRIKMWNLSESGERQRLHLGGICERMQQLCISNQARTRLAEAKAKVFNLNMKFKRSWICERMQQLCINAN